MPPKALLTRYFFSPLRTEAENTLLEQEASTEPGRPPPTVMTYTKNIIRLQSDLKASVKREYEFRNPRYGTRIITKQMYYSVMKSYLEKNNLHYITFSVNSEKPIKAAIRHLPTEKPAEDISNGLEDLGFNVSTRGKCQPLEEHPTNKPT
jgi:hypothetical protein